MQMKIKIEKSAVDAGFRVEVEVYGVFTRALREADRRRVDAYSVREKQGLVPDLQIDDDADNGTTSVTARQFAC
jgi:hypothetical protein